MQSLFVVSTGYDFEGSVILCVHKDRQCRYAKIV